MAEHQRPGMNIITRNNQQLPSEIIFFQILPRLPVKYLPLAMSVCKKWKLFLRSGTFATAYHHHMLTHDDHQNHHKHLVLSTNRTAVHSIDCETPQDGLSVVNRSLLFLPIGGKMSILTCLHGLVCAGTTEEENPDVYLDLYLWNPLTNEYKILSKPKKGFYTHHKECYKTSEGIFGLYYIASDDDYRLLRVTHLLNIYIYSLKSNSWKIFESTEDFRQRASTWTPREQASHILLDEKLYFLKQVDTGEGTFIRSYSVMRFDIKTEKFTEIAIPSFGNRMTNCLGFMLLKGGIHFCVAIQIEEEIHMANQRNYEMIELWRMDGDRDWTKVLTYGPMLFSVWGQSMLHLMKNGNLLIQDGGDVYLLDMKNHTEEKLFTCQRRDYKIPLIGKYIETAISPNKYHSIVSKRFPTKNGLKWCTVRSWEEYNALERDMLEKDEEDITQHAGDADELWALSQRGRKDRTLGVGSSNHQFMLTGPSPYGAAMSSKEYAKCQMQVRELQSQLEMERKAREQMQDQIAKERKEMQDEIEKERRTERKAREEMQDQIEKEWKMERKAREEMQDQIAKERKEMHDEIEKERKVEQKAREEMQDQIEKERKIERKAREDMQAQISELMSRCANHFGTSRNPV